MKKTSDGLKYYADIKALLKKMCVCLNISEVSHTSKVNKPTSRCYPMMENTDNKVKEKVFILQVNENVLCIADIIWYIKYIRTFCHFAEWVRCS